jgi:type VI secretion system protein ImpH
MAQPDRQTPNSLAGELVSQPHVFNFFQAVRRLEAEYKDWPRVGWSQRLEEDFLRFCQVPSLSFAPSSLEKVEQAEGVIRIFVNFLGMFGPNGPLPQHLTDFARDRQRNLHDPTLVRFIDIFHQRMLSFFYRAWAINVKSVDFDRSDQARYATYFGSLFGIGIPSLRDRDNVSDWAKIHYSGRLATQTRNAEGLEAILGDYFGLPTKICEFAGSWMKIPKENQLLAIQLLPRVEYLPQIVDEPWIDCRKFKYLFLRDTNIHRTENVGKSMRAWPRESAAPLPEISFLPG